MFTCSFCGKEFEIGHSKSAHEGWCNPVHRKIQEEARAKWKINPPPKLVASALAMGKKHKGISKTEEHKQKLRDAKLGTKQTPEHILAVKEALARPEIKEKMSINTKLLFQDPEWRAKNTASMTDFARTPENREFRRKLRMNQVFPRTATLIEIKLWNELESRKISFEKNKSTLGITQPDAFIEPNIAIYADGCFWHACPKHYPLEKFIGVKWDFKIGKKVELDKNINEQLINNGYKVFRFWEHDINKDIKACVDKIYGTV